MCASLQELILTRRVVEFLSRGVPDEVLAIRPQIFEVACERKTLTQLLDPDGKRDPLSKAMNPLKEARRLIARGGHQHLLSPRTEQLLGIPRTPTLRETLRSLLSELRLVLARMETRKMKKACDLLGVRWVAKDDQTTKLRKISLACDSQLREAESLATDLRGLVDQEVPMPILDDDTPIDVLVGHVRYLRSLWNELAQKTAPDIARAA